MIASCLVAGAFLLAPSQYKELATTSIAATFSLSNFEFYRLIDYFNSNADIKPLLHTWSLSVEEQFYLFFPVAFVGILRFRKSTQAWALLFAFLCSAALEEILRHKSVSAAFYFAPSRGFEFICGVLVNYIPSVSVVSRRILAVLAALLLVGSIFSLPFLAPLPGLALCVPCVATAVLLYSGEDDSQGPVVKVLCLSPLRHIGDWSYSIYLWHWPILALARSRATDDLSPGSIVVLVLCAIAIGCFSYLYIERPILKIKLARRASFVFAGAGSGLILICSGVICILQGFPQRYSPEAQVLFSSANDFNHRREECHGNDDSSPSYGGSCLWGDPHGVPEIVIWGDSHGAELSVALGKDEAKNHLAVRELTYSACPPSIDYRAPTRHHCIKHNRDMLGSIINDARVRVVVMVANASLYSEDPAFLEGVRRAALRISRAGKRVVLVKPFPLMRDDPPTTLGLAYDRGSALSGLGILKSQYEINNRKVRAGYDDIASSNDLIATYDPATRLCNADLCTMYAEKRQLVKYFNREHLSVAGASLLVPGLEKTMALTQAISQVPKKS
jgi:peptidoglycan/LPS O-acetylase OafA/YrhL